MTATPTGRDRHRDRPDGTPTPDAVPGPAPAGRGEGPRPGEDCHGLSCSFPLCDWPWCDDDLVVAGSPGIDDDWWDGPTVPGHLCCGCAADQECDEDCCMRRLQLGTVWDHGDPLLFDDGSAAAGMEFCCQACAVVLGLSARKRDPA